MEVRSLSNGDTRGRGYSIWLIPRETEKLNELSSLIRRISEEQSTPVFKPHVTLVGTILGEEPNVIQQTEALASRIGPYEVKFGAVDRFDEYFRALFVRIQKEPAVLEANQEARLTFGKEGDPEYMPHLSLMYAKGLGVDAKDQIIKAHDLAETFRRLGGFSITSLSLYSTEGQLDEWHHVRDFELKALRKT